MEGPRHDLLRTQKYGGFLAHRMSNKTPLWSILDTQDVILRNWKDNIHVTNIKSEKFSIFYEIAKMKYYARPINRE